MNKLNQVATELSPAQIDLYLAIADVELCAVIQAGLPAQYRCFHFKTINDLVNAISIEQPALILCQDELVNGNDSTLLASIKKVTSARILMIGATHTIDEQIAMLRQGARGYFDSALPIDKLSGALHCVLHGEVWFRWEVISELVDGLASEPGISEEQQSLLASLTPKEMDVAKQVSHGATNKMIAKTMVITERTVKAHLTAIFHKLAIPDRLALAILIRDLR